MKPQGNGQSRPFAVSMSKAIREQIKAIHRDEIASGRGHEVLSAFRHIVRRLETDPIRFGEPLYRLPALRLMVHQAIVLPLLVNFAVHETQPLVFIRGFVLLPPNP
jgi:hypothetical protein